MTVTTTPTAYPDVATREEWLAARKKLLARERDVTHLRDAVNAERRRMPRVKVEKDYVFEGPAGELRLEQRHHENPETSLPLHRWLTRPRPGRTDTSTGANSALC